MRTRLYREKFVVDGIEVCCSLVDREDSWFLAVASPASFDEKARSDLHVRAEAIFDEISRRAEDAPAKGHTIYFQKIGEDAFERRNLPGRTFEIENEPAPDEHIISRAWLDELLDTWRRTPTNEPETQTPPAFVGYPSLQCQAEGRNFVSLSFPNQETGRVEYRDIWYQFQSYVGSEDNPQQARPIVIVLSDQPENRPGNFDLASSTITHAVQQVFHLGGFPAETTFLLHYPENVHGEESPERFVRAKLGYNPGREQAAPSVWIDKPWWEMRPEEVVKVLGPENVSSYILESAREALYPFQGVTFKHARDISPDLDIDFHP